MRVEDTSVQSGVRVAALAVIVTMGCVLGRPAGADDWPVWRGPDRTGISRETAWNPKAMDAPPKILWRADIGVGYASFSIAAGRAYTMGNRNDEDQVLCFNAADGREIWKHTYPCKAQSHAGTRATPVVDGDRVYTLSRDGQAFCLDAGTGAVVWQRHAVSELGHSVPTWGIAGSPLIYKNMVILNIGRHGVALDKKTGKTIWSSDKDKGGYSTPVLFVHEGRDLLAIFGAKALFAVDSASGSAAWSFPWETRYDVNAADPLVHKGRVFISSGYGRGCALLNIAGATPATVWENKLMSNHFSSSVLHDGFLYGIDGNTGRGHLRCIEWESGQERWAQDTGFGSLILVGGKLVVLNENSVLTIAEANPEAFVSISSARLLDGKTFWTPPAFSDGRLFVRNHAGAAACIDLR